MASVNYQVNKISLSVTSRDDSLSVLIIHFVSRVQFKSPDASSFTSFAFVDDSTVSKLLLAILPASIRYNVSEGKARYNNRHGALNDFQRASRYSKKKKKKKKKEKSET